MNRFILQHDTPTALSSILKQSTYSLLYISLVMALSSNVSAAQSITTRYPEQFLLESGPVTHDRFGFASALLGDWLLVGAPNDDEAGKNAGAVIIYRRSEDGQQWLQHSKLIPQPANQDDRFGFSVAAFAETVLIGAPGAQGQGVNSGAAYLFNYHVQSNTWMQTAKLVADNGLAGDRFGSSVALNDGNALIGAKLDDAFDEPLALTIQSNQGFKTSACDKKSTCTQQPDKPQPPSKRTFQFGKLDTPDTGIDSGSVYAFQRESAQQWQQTQQFLSSAHEGGDLFGHAIAMDGDTAVISAPGKDVFDELGAGAAFIFRQNSAGEWLESFAIVGEDYKLDDHFGQSLAIQNQIIAVGATQKDGNGFNTGSVYLFKKSPSNAEWLQTSQLAAPGLASNDEFGAHLALFNNDLLVSAYNPELGTIGAVYAFEKSGEQWQYGSEVANQSSSTRSFGSSLALNAHSIAIGVVDPSQAGAMVLYTNSAVDSAVQAPIPPSQPKEPEPIPQPISKTPINPGLGLWWNPQRAGHGMDIQRVGDNMLIIWYTYREDGTPIWYLGSAAYAPDSAKWSATLDEYHWDGQQATPAPAGQVELAFSDKTHAQLSWQFDAQQGSEPIELFISSSQVAPVDYTGTWYQPELLGYGLTVSTLGNNETIVLYFYDAQGQSIWALGSQQAEISTALQMDVYQGFCPACPASQTSSNPAGNLSLNYLSPATARFTSAIELPTPFAGDWLFDDIALGNLTWNLPASLGVTQIADRSVFDQLAADSAVTGALAVSEIKFLISNVDTDAPQFYFVKSKGGDEATYHYDFARSALKQYQQLSYQQGRSQFGAEAYFSEERKYIAGSIIAHDHYSDSQQQGIYTVEFWPTDPISYNFVEQTYRAVQHALPFAADQLAYHPVGDTQQRLYQNNQQQYQQIPTLLTEQLLGAVNQAVLNHGEAYGRLTVVNPGDPTPGPADIVIYRFIPNDLPHVAGIMTETAQTPLSHINLKARQNNTPNAYLKDASSAPEISALIDQWVHLTTSNSGVSLTSASQQQAEQWLENIRPAQPQIPDSDLSVDQPVRLTDIAHFDWKRYGVKAANVAELAKILPAGMVPDGYAVPFALYDQFMQLPRCGDSLRELCAADEHGVSLYEQATQMMADTAFQQDPAVREKDLKTLRKNIEKADAPQAMIDTLETIRLFWDPAGAPYQQKLRTRSSTNNEDLPGFNGAGLYESYTHKPDEGNLIKSIKQVWASLWTARAFEERRFYRIDHLKTYMGVLIHPNFGDEQANGVSVSKNIYNPDWQGIYTNVQHGEISITNPEPIESDSGIINPIPDEFVLSRLPSSATEFDWELQIIRQTNVTEVYGQTLEPGAVLFDSEIVQLQDAMLTIHDHFKLLHNGDEDFAMEVEFKITETSDGSRGKLAIKQARPWID